MKKILYLFAFLAVSIAGAQDFTGVISSYLNSNRAQLGLQPQDFEDITINSQSFSKSMQAHTVYVSQNYQGIEIFNSVASFAVKNNQVVYASRGFIPSISTKVNTINPGISALDAISKATTALGLSSPSNLELLESSNNSYVFSNGTISLENIPVKLVYHYTETDQLILAWDLSIYLLNATHYYSVRIDALTGALLDTNDWVSSCDFGDVVHSHETSSKSILFGEEAAGEVATAGGAQYRVFAMPLRNPDNGPDTLENSPDDAIASPFGWHDTDGAAGAEFTITRGNNVWAQEDQNNNNGTGYSPDGGVPLVFDFPFGLPQPPQAFLDGSITNLFYWNNIIHDVMYQYGFDELSGNFQENNYGNGGLGSDSVNADAQDGGGTNNANFATPPDGQNPRMQMYIWTGSTGAVPGLLTINNGPLAGSYEGHPAGFGGPFLPAPLTEDLVVIEDDDAGVSTDPNDGCDNITNGGALNGKIVVIRRGECEFGFKSLAAQNAGAVAVIIVNNVAGATILMGGGAVGASVTIPVFMINNIDGEAIIAELLALNTVNGTINGALVPPNIDGDLDNEIVVHEYGHGISNRLTGGPGAAGCLQNAEQMGEGWSDYIGLVMTMQPGDQEGDIRGMASYASGNPNGIREAPYSTDFGVNDYTYADVNGNVSVPHGVGFVWATMLWEMTWDLIDVYGWDSDIYNGTGGNNIALQLVTDGMKLQPCSPGFVDGRDAILQADIINNAGANQCLIWDAFARRGLGLSASQGSSNSTSDGVEAYDVPTSPGCLLGVTDNSLDNNFVIYPNPSNGNLNIKSVIDAGDVTISIFDLNGRKVYSQNTALNGTVSINVTNLSTGMYIVQIDGVNYVHNAKIVIE
ncbi:putative secreted protein (Por secretion system target) [Ulvibacter sp. MAR_2010_11]|uniref:T9SS-dependent M36 family metallopeptidase n=1 Tax=Ulvibacter sp. MAR_2010_11 TaxID=1250229 RepID=UPI000C2CD9D4|nr:T9SS-dependent M36 family metallopeptidase [Ulvibacter sp. MAR_2010_11]PKA83162.1 putative secreted protein (Por secretion system target) [Ulvibacter sp. MAR_2010_11]